MRQLYNGYPHLKSLNKFSKAVLKCVAQAYPTWIPRALVEPESSCLIIAVASPHRPEERGLIFSTEGGCITVHFDWYHAHFYGNNVKTPAQIFDDTKPYIEDIFHERRIIAIKLDDRREHYQTATNLTPEMLDTIQPGQYSYTRSWLGTFDRTYDE